MRYRIVDTARGSKTVRVRGIRLFHSHAIALIEIARLTSPDNPGRYQVQFVPIPAAK